MEPRNEVTVEPGPMRIGSRDRTNPNPPNRWCQGRPKGSPGFLPSGGGTNGGEMLSKMHQDVNIATGSGLLTFRMDAYGLSILVESDGPEKDQMDLIPVDSEEAAGIAFALRKAAQHIDALAKTLQGREARRA